MRPHRWLVALAMLLVGCSTPAPPAQPPAPPAVTPTPAPAPPSPPPQVTRPGTGSLPIKPGTPEQLAPFYHSISAAVPGVFVRKGDELTYVEGDRRVELSMGKNPVVLAASEDAALLSDADRLYWFVWKVGSLIPVPDLPPVRQAVRQGSVYLLATANNEVLFWAPDETPVRLARPENVFNVVDISLSPKGDHAAVAYDLDIPGGPRVGAVWAYDFQTGKVFKHPDPPPAVAGGYGMWLLGWSDDSTLRLVSGVREFRGGTTWRLGEGEPKPDGTEYRMMDGAVRTDSGAWFIYRPIPEQAVVQSIQPDSEPLGLPFPKGGVYDPRVLLNGHAAAHDRTGWIELLPDGTQQRWEGAEFLY